MIKYNRAPINRVNIYFKDSLKFSFFSRSNFILYIINVVTITDKEGNVITWAAPGAVGFKGSKKSTPYAAGIAAEKAAKEAYDMGMRKVNVVVKGVGPGRDTAVRSLEVAGLEVMSISDVTPIPHNGCRPPKRPRN